MKTIYAGLPIYSALNKRESERSHNKIPFYTPNTCLPPFQICDTIADASTYFIISLVNCNGTATDISSKFIPALTGWTNGGFTTFTTSGANITSAIDTTGINYCYSNSFYIHEGDSVAFIGTLTLTSGDAPEVYLYGNSATKSNVETLSAGSNSKVLISTYTGYVTFRLATSGATNFSLATVSMSYSQIYIKNLTNYSYGIYRGTPLVSTLPYGIYYLKIETEVGPLYYSEQFAVINTSKANYCKIACSNTHDLGDILYASGDFEEVYYLPTQLNYPSNEMIEIGEEKDGIFETEKLISKYLFRISAYVSRALHRCLIRLPQHDVITITDEVGNIYTPSVGNLSIITSEFNSFDVCHMVIQFNDGENSAFKWTENMADMV